MKTEKIGILRDGTRVIVTQIEKIISTAPKISELSLKRMLGVNYRTAWYLCKASASLPRRNDVALRQSKESVSYSVTRC